MAYCDSCNTLRDVAPEIELQGITDKMCEALKEDKGLNPDLKVLHNNCTDINSIIDCFIGSLASKIPSYDPCQYEGFATDLLNNLRTTLDAIACSDCGQWEQIWLIWEEIRKLWEALQDLAGGIYTYLTPGTDYSTVFYNNWHTSDGTGTGEETGSGYVRVGYYTILNYYYIRVTGGTGTGTLLAHQNLNNVRIRHSDPVADTPGSWMFGVTFNGKWAFLNDYRFTNTSSSSTGIWNVFSPGLSKFGLRASWQAALNLADGRNVSGAGNTILGNIAQYADGANSQFTVYERDSLYTNHVNFDCQCLFRP